jgi:hypothetical protein
MGLDFRDQMRILEKRIPPLAVTPSDLDEFAATGCVETSLRPLAALDGGRPGRDRRPSPAR